MSAWMCTVYARQFVSASHWPYIRFYEDGWTPLPNNHMYNEEKSTKQKYLLYMKFGYLRAWNQKYSKEMHEELKMKPKKNR